MANKRHRWQYRGESAGELHLYGCLFCPALRWAAERQTLQDAQNGCGGIVLDGWVVA